MGGGGRVAEAAWCFNCCSYDGFFAGVLWWRLLVATVFVVCEVSGSVVEEGFASLHVWAELTLLEAQ